MKLTLLVFVMLSTVMLLGCEANKVRRLFNSPARHSMFSEEEKTYMSEVVF